jgi:hypothetical protein
MDEASVEANGVFTLVRASKQGKTTPVAATVRRCSAISKGAPFYDLAIHYNTR